MAGRFANMMEEYLYGLAQDCDWDGDVQGFGLAWSMLDLSEYERAYVGTDYRFWLVVENDLGFVAAIGYPTEHERDDIVEGIERRFWA